MTKIVYDLLLALEQCDDTHNRCDYLMEHNEITYLLEYITNLRQENQQLKEWKELHSASILAKENIRVNEENQKLKKQLEEKQNPLKGIFSQVNDDMLLRNCGAMQIEIDTYKNQQKKFIKYLEEKEKQFDILGDPKNAGACKGILQKYKEIIGVLNENNMGKSK